MLAEGGRVRDAIPFGRTPAPLPSFHFTLVGFMLKLICIWKRQLNLGYFGADSLKPVYIYSNMVWVGELAGYYCRNWCPNTTEVTIVSMGFTFHQTTLMGFSLGSPTPITHKSTR